MGLCIVGCVDLCYSKAFAFCLCAGIPATAIELTGTAYVVVDEVAADELTLGENAIHEARARKRAVFERHAHKSGDIEHAKVKARSLKLAAEEGATKDRTLKI